MNKIVGRKRRKLKGTIRSMKHQHSEYGLTEVELMKLTDLENELKRKVK